jgi:hypothetical protein
VIWRGKYPASAPYSVCLLTHFILQECNEPTAHRQKRYIPRLALSQFRSLSGPQSVRLQILTLSCEPTLTVASGLSAIKLAKQILRDARQNLVLWDGYARVERQRGRIQEARQVYITALSMYRTFAPQYQIDGPLLWRSWAEMEWEAGRPMLALRILAASWAVSDVDLGKFVIAHFPLCASSLNLGISASLAAQPEDARPTPAQVLRARQVGLWIILRSPRCQS